MDKPKDLFILEGISCLAFNKNFSMCVLSKKDNNLYIYEIVDKKNINTWKLKYTLSIHMLYICSVDWHPETNKIISSSHDKNIFVWSYQIDSDSWKPEIVIFKTKVSVLNVKWNKKGDKFTACTGCKLVGTGYFETDNNWWSCKKMKEHFSSVTCAKFDDTGLYIVSGSTDNRINITSGYVEDIDGNGNNNEPHGFVIKGIKSDAWVNDVCWLPSGICIAATHDSIIYIIDKNLENYETILLTHSPISHLLPLSENSFIAVSFNRHIYIYEKDQEWKMKKCITKNDSIIDIVKKNEESTGGSIHERMKMFSGGNKKQSIIITSNQQPKNIHTANINSVTLCEDFIITSDFAGFIKIWSL